MVREYVEGMREISGFGGSYEAACRKMVLAGLDWFDAHPDATPKIGAIKGVFGITTTDNDDAKELEEAVVQGSGAADDVTGAMVHAAMNHIFFVRHNGWEKYVEEMSKPDGKES